MEKHIRLPLTQEDIGGLRAGDYVYLTGELYTARDAAHKRMAETLDAGGTLPFEIAGQTIYYMGPSPARQGHVIGSAGPTTASRMDKYTPRLLDLGMKGMVGKGRRSGGVRRRSLPPCAEIRQYILPLSAGRARSFPNVSKKPKPSLMRIWEQRQYGVLWWRNFPLLS